MNVNQALNYLVDYENLVRPHGVSAGSFPGGLRDLNSRAKWDAYQWNPPQYLTSRYPDPDPNASPKPTWDELVSAFSKHQINETKRTTESILYSPAEEGFGWAPNPASTRQSFADAATILHGGDQVHVHGGIDRMTGLISSVEDANESGEHIPLIVMRDEDNQPLHLHTQKQLRPLLNEVRKRKNTVESAHNLVMQQYQVIASVRDDETQDLDTRLAKANEARTFVDNYETHLTAAMESYDPDALPTDLETLKDTYRERLEATALARTKFLKGVLTQQGVDLHPSCDDQENALRSVAMQEQLGSQAITLAADADGARTAYDRAVRLIGDIQALNVPRITIGSKVVPNNPDRVIRRMRETIDVTVANPVTDPVIPGTPVLTFTSDTGRDVLTGTEITGGFRFAFAAGVADGTKATLQLLARNICGPAQVQLELTKES